MRRSLPTHPAWGWRGDRVAAHRRCAAWAMSSPTHLLVRADGSDSYLLRSRSALHRARDTSPPKAERASPHRNKLSLSTRRDGRLNSQVGNQSRLSPDYAPPDAESLCPPTFPSALRHVIRFSRSSMQVSTCGVPAQVSLQVRFRYTSREQACSQLSRPRPSSSASSSSSFQRVP